MRRYKVVQYFLLFSIICLFLTNAYSVELSNGLAELDTSNCHATYFPAEGKLLIPCIDVVDATGNVQAYRVVLEQLATADTQQFMVKEWFANPQDLITPEESNCQATYLLESGKLLMPCVDVVDSSGQVESHEVVMRQVDSTLVELPKLEVMEVDNKEYIITDSQSIIAERSHRSNCTYKISSTNRYFLTGGGSGSVNVSTSANCRWSASSGVNWVTITSGKSATGTGTVKYRVSRNDGDIKRGGKLTVVGKTLTITQEGFCDTVPFGDMAAIVFVTRCGYGKSSLPVEVITSIKKQACLANCSMDNLYCQASSALLSTDMPDCDYKYEKCEKLCP